MNDKKEIGAALREIRLRKGYSKYYMNKQGLALPLLNAVENGTTSYTVDKLLAICNVLDVDLIEFLKKSGVS